MLNRYTVRVRRLQYVVPERYVAEGALPTLDVLQVQAWEIVCLYSGATPPILMADVDITSTARTTEDVALETMQEKLKKLGVDKLFKVTKVPQPQQTLVSLGSTASLCPGVVCLACSAVVRRMDISDSRHKYDTAPIERHCRDCRALRTRVEKPGPNKELLVQALKAIDDRNTKALEKSKATKATVGPRVALMTVPASAVAFLEPQAKLRCVERAT